MSNVQRPAWVEIDTARLRSNFEIFLKDKPAELGFISVVKDQAYGHGIVPVAKMAAEFGATMIAVSTVNEALELRKNQISKPIIIFGERTAEELEICAQYDLSCFVNDLEQAKRLAEISKKSGRRSVVHTEVDTGLSRHGIRWTIAPVVIEAIKQFPELELQGVMSHFAMSDELDKSFALLQLQRFNDVLTNLEQKGIKPKFRHMCNTGGFLDLPQAHFDLVRIGILPLGVYPSQVCRRIHGLKPVMSVKCKIALIREIEAGNVVGYGMHYKVESTRRIAVLPIGYGDGYPRVRNSGEVLIAGKRASVVGGNAMDAMMIDISDIPEVKVWDEVVLMGEQGNEEIDVHEIAKLKGSVSYDVLAGWRSRLPRVYV